RILRQSLTLSRCQVAARGYHVPARGSKGSGPCLRMIRSENRCPLFRIMLYRRRMIRSFLTVSSGTLASRLLGFLRDSMVAALLGAGPVADAFLLAFQLVNVVRRLLTEGALNAALVPAWLRLRDSEGAAAAAAFAGKLLGTV